MLLFWLNDEKLLILSLKCQDFCVYFLMNMHSVFNVIPSEFFTILGSGNRNQAVYSELLLKIYKLFDDEISYRILRDIVRDTIAAYLLENHIEIKGMTLQSWGWNLIGMSKRILLLDVL